MGGSQVCVAEPELPLGHRSFFPCCGQKESALGRHCRTRGERDRAIRFQAPSEWLFLEERDSRGNSPCMVDPLMSWCVSDSGWIFFCRVAAVESFVRPRIHPVSSSYASFSSRWDEFGQNRRGSESTAAPRRGPRVSFTENFKQQSRNFRELKQRVFRHRVGRYTVRVLLATRFLLLGTITVYFKSP